MMAAESLVLLVSLIILKDVQGNTPQCTSKMDSCHGMAQQMGSAGPAEFMTSKSLRDDCRKWQEVFRCLKTALHTTQCQDGLTIQEQASMHMAASYIDYVCVEKINDIVKYRDCYTSSGVVDSCNVNSGVNTCNAERVVSCGDRVLGASQKCNAAAKQLFRDIVRGNQAAIASCASG